MSSSNEGEVRKIGFISLKKKDVGLALPRVTLDESETTSAVENAPRKAPPRSIFESKISREEQATIAKALEQDALVYEYDAVYEADKQRTREVTQTNSVEKPEERKAKYIFGLFRSAAVRQLESERREERKIQKELEDEQKNGEKVECYVTDSYRRKLKEIRELEEAERRNEAANEEAARYDPLAINRLLFAQRTGEKLPTSHNEDSAEAQRHVAIQKKILNLSKRTFRKRKSASHSDSEAESSDSDDLDAASTSNAADAKPELESENQDENAKEPTAAREAPALQPSGLDQQEPDAEINETSKVEAVTSAATRQGFSAIETLKRQLETGEQKLERWKAKCAKRHTEESVLLERERYFERKAIRSATRDYLEREQAAV